VGDSSNNKTVTVCRTVIIPLSLKALKQQFDKPPVTSPELKQPVLLISKCSLQQQHKELDLT
jgi:hypothetical protein